MEKCLRQSGFWIVVGSVVLMVGALFVQDYLQLKQQVARQQQQRAAVPAALPRMGPGGGLLERLEEDRQEDELRRAQQRVREQEQRRQEQEERLRKLEQQRSNERLRDQLAPATSRGGY